MKIIAYTPLLLALAIGQAIAETPINLSAAARPDAHVSIDNVKGEVTVTAWDKPQVEVSGSLGSGARPLKIEGDDRNLDIKVSGGDDSRWFSWKSDNSMGSTILNVRVPKGVSLDINVVSAPVTIDGLDGGKVNVESVSGRVRMNARTRSISLNTVSGSIDLGGHADDATLQTVSGDVTAPSVGSTLKAETVSGHMSINGGPYRRAELSTVSGDLQLGGGIEGDGSINIDSMSGDVQVSVPANLSARITASSFSGQLRSDFGEAKKGDEGPGSELDATAGNGRGKLHVETFSGDLKIRKGQ
jgi:DUF4097 and DUF4098 domain-containing protein YvlB